MTWGQNPGEKKKNMPTLQVYVYNDIAEMKRLAQNREHWSLMINF